MNAAEILIQATARAAESEARRRGERAALYALACAVELPDGASSVDGTSLRWGEHPDVLVILGADPLVAHLYGPGGEGGRSVQGEPEEIRDAIAAHLAARGWVTP